MKTQSNLKQLDFSGRDLEGHDFSGEDLAGAKFFRANLKRALFTGANLKGADFTGADLEGANLEGVDAEAAGFGMANLKKARLFNAKFRHASFTKATLKGADAKCADFSLARLREADLREADFSGAKFKEAHLNLSRVEGAIFKDADLRGAHLRMIKGYKKAIWIGTDIRDINFSGAYLVRRHIIDENYLEEFRQQGRLARILYFLWWLTSDCGRSLGRWCLLIVFQALFFAYLYHLVGVDYGKYPTPLSPLYYSIVTLTTLGYGDVIPNSLLGQVIAILEVITGYVMLGGLLAIFTNRIARRAD
ncbi:Ion transport 2 domain protein [Thermodesulfatator indicus DSM 15286]|uniref:Ion transport 2 domain protein n=1 Tax=Thermodesulfatator indicus (strain DSM 15286 / JCM 11887 / CIR29812) TaxID=667014 RepID=F8A9P8_THEID|nr:pentapeptide repeat-containing protein [Thermodesulfatator indicus]AEH45283.1 Ion transport 2 domain protein [Thermodesulfatator indicus DSM 15286]